MELSLTRKIDEVIWAPFYVLNSNFLERTGQRYRKCTNTAAGIVDLDEALYNFEYQKKTVLSSKGSCTDGFEV